MSYEDLKIGKLVQTVLKPLIISKVTKQEISKMQELEYSKATFGIQYPLLLKTTSVVAEKHYYSDLFTINEETYRLCCEWYETEKNNDRPYVEKWIKEHETKVATFADVVMEEPEYIASSSKDIKVSSNKPKKRSALSDILKTLDPVAFHSEYYSYNGFYKDAPSHTVANGKWIFCRDWRNETTYIMDENGQNKVYLELNKKYIFDNINSYLCGMNNKGIWFMRMEGRQEGEYIHNTFVCFNSETGNEKIIPFNASNYEIKSVYIYGDTIYYVGCKEKVGQKLVKIDSFGIETVLYSTESEDLDRVSVYANHVAFRVKYYKHVCWCIMDTNSYKTVFLREKERTSPDFIRIVVLDLKNNTVWTTMTASECLKYYVYDEALVARNLEKLIVEDYSFEGAFPIFHNAVQNRHIWYFDGKNSYNTGRAAVWRQDKAGVEYCVSGSGYGMAETILVSENFLFVTYDNFSFGISRLPRDFSTAERISPEKNPEVSFIFDEHQTL